MMKRLRSTFSFGLSILFLGGCSANGKVLIGGKDPVPVSYVALLPAERPIGVRAERVERTRELVAGELRNKGLLIVEDRIVNSVCSVPECPEWSELFSRYHVDGIADLKLSSVSNGDFFLGRYSTISGTLEFRGKSGAPLYKTETNTRQTGGLLFNTGAVVQAVKTLADSFQDATFEPLAQKFAKDLVGDINFRRDDAARAASEDLQIGAVTVKELNAQRRKLCVQASPSNLLTISSRSLVSDLSEVSPGNYCAVYPARSLRSIESYSAQLRTPSGISITKQLGAPVQRGRFERGT